MVRSAGDRFKSDSSDTDQRQGDLGTTAKEVEKSLDINLTLANRWDCILLLDEADVFLAQRNREDFQRNALVAGQLSTIPTPQSLLESDVTLLSLSSGS